MICKDLYMYGSHAGYGYEYGSHGMYGSHTGHSVPSFSSTLVIAKLSSAV